MNKDDKNKFQHNDDGTTYIFLESKKSKRYPGKHTIIIDSEDWDKVKEHRWGAKKCGNSIYSQTSIPHPDGGWYYFVQNGKQQRGRRRTCLFMHHLIMVKPKEGMVTDHINRNGLDNRKENLRLVTKAQNQQNRKSQKRSTSGYKGVSWVARDKRWRSEIMHEKNHFYLGYFTCEHEAALAYNKKALELGQSHNLLNEVAETYNILP